MLWEIKFSTLGVVTKMEKYSAVNVSHVITEKLHFWKRVLMIKRPILCNCGYRFPRIGFLRTIPRISKYHPINTPPTMLQYIQFSNPVSDIFSSDGAHLDSYDTCSQSKRFFSPTSWSTVGIIWNAIRFATANTIANSIRYQVKLGQDSLGIWALSRPTTNRI